MKYSTIICGNLFLCCFYAEAQLPVIDPNLPIAEYHSTFSGSYGNGLYSQPQTTAGLFNFSYAAIAPTPGPFYNQISAQTLIGGYGANPSPLVLITGSILPSSLSGVTLNTTASITYAFTVAGSPGTAVSVAVTGSILGNATQLASPPIFPEVASSSLYVADSMANLNAADAMTYLSDSTSTLTPSYNDSVLNPPSLSLIAGTWYYVQLNASLELNGTFSGSPMVSGNTDVDPSFTLTPEEIADGYQIEFSPGIITPAPEPSIRTLFLAGVGMLAFFARRKTIKT